MSRLDPSKMTPTQLAEAHVATAQGEALYDEVKCRAASFSLVGVNNSAISGGVDCPSSWSRQQYQLNRLPQ